MLLVVGVGLAYAVYRLPPVYARLGWRVEGLRTQILYALDPPEQAVFVPQQVAEVGAGLPAPAVRTTRTAPVATPTLQAPAASRESNQPTPTPTQTPTPLPEQVTLGGVIHEYQQMNNCGPATLAMALSYWGWQGNQVDTRAVLRPNYVTVDDKNVNPDEMVSYVQEHTDLQALARAGGDAETLKRLIAAGFPVLIEKGFQPHGDYWMGHYELLTGYDDAASMYYAQDSYIMPDLPVPYAEIEERWWRDFNRPFLVVYPPEQEEALMAALGPYADPMYGYRMGAQLASRETETLFGRDLYFAWFSLGTNLVRLEDYAGAAEAYDLAFALYPRLPEADRPWRALWYQAGPYEAYFHTGRYEDLLALGNQTLGTAGRPVLEESYYWMGKAREAQGDMDKAIQNYRNAAALNPYSTPALAELQRLGVEP